MNNNPNRSSVNQPSTPPTPPTPPKIKCYRCQSENVITSPVELWDKKKKQKMIKPLCVCQDCGNQFEPPKPPPPKKQQLSTGCVIAVLVGMGILILPFIVAVIIGASNSSSRPQVSTPSTTESSLSSYEKYLESKAEESAEKERLKEMISVKGATCKRNSESVPEITITYHFLNNTGEKISFANKFIDNVKYEKKFAPCIKVIDEEAFEKELSPGESIDVDLVYEGSGTITGFLEVELSDLKTNEQLYWKCFTLS